MTLSVEEINKFLPDSEERKKEGTDHAKCQNLWVGTNGFCGAWWLRSPYEVYASNARAIYFNGKIESFGNFGAVGGIVPAIVIK